MCHYIMCVRMCLKDYIIKLGIFDAAINLISTLIKIHSISALTPKKLKYKIGLEASRQN